MSPRFVIAIDPGLADTGALVYDLAGREILDAKVFRSPAQGPRPFFVPTVDRVRKTSREVLEYVRVHGPATVVLEAYRDIPGELRRAKDRWTTPLAIGYLICRLDEDNTTVVFQDPETVMRSYAGAVAMWQTGASGIVRGDKLIARNEHLRSAGAHLLAYLDASRIAQVCQ